MRAVIALAAFAALSSSALAQQARPPAPRPAAPPAAAAPQPPAPPPIFLCRTAEEICFLAVVTGPSQISILFTNATAPEGAEPKPIEVSTGDAPGTPLDLAPNLGRVVLLTGTLDAKAGLTKANLVEVASPLVSTLVKVQVMGAPGEEGPGGPPPKGGAKPPAGKKR